jgi:hypothetical protein
VPEKVYAEILRVYNQTSVSKRIEALFLDNLGKVVTREQIMEVAKDPTDDRVPENWHQRLSELRTDRGYTILTRRDRADLAVSEYLMPTAERRSIAAKRVRPNTETWAAVLRRAGARCEWSEAGEACGLANGDLDPVGGGTVRLTPDHKAPHAVNPATDPDDPEQWQALCGRHQVMKKNYWDNTTGKLNIYALVQAAQDADKRVVFDFLSSYFGYTRAPDGSLVPRKAPE